MLNIARLVVICLVLQCSLYAEGKKHTTTTTTQEPPTPSLATDESELRTATSTKKIHFLHQHVKQHAEATTDVSTVTAEGEETTPTIQTDIPTTTIADMPEPEQTSVVHPITKKNHTRKIHKMIVKHTKLHHFIMLKNNHSLGQNESNQTETKLSNYLVLISYKEFFLFYLVFFVRERFN